MEKLLSALLLLISLSGFSQFRPNSTPPTITFRQGNANRLNMIVTQAGITLTPSSSLTIVTEIRQTEGGRILATIPMLVGDTASGAIQGTLPNLAPNLYVAGLYIKYASEPEFRAGVAKLEILPPGDIRVITDVTGLNVNLTTTAQILSVRIDATPSSAITGYYAQVVRADKAHIDSVKVDVLGSTNSALAYKNAAGVSADSALNRANRTLTFRNQSGVNADSALARTNRALQYRNDSKVNADSALARTNRTLTFRNQSSVNADSALARATRSLTFRNQSGINADSSLARATRALTFKNNAQTSAANAATSEANSTTAATQATTKAAEAAASAASIPGLVDQKLNTFTGNVGIFGQIASNTAVTTVWSNPASGAYSGTYLRNSLQYLSIASTITATTAYSAVSAIFWAGDNTTAATVRLYESNNSEVVPANMTFIQEWTYAAGALPTTAGSVQSLSLTVPRSVASGKTLVLFIVRTSGTNVNTYQVGTTDPGYSSVNEWWYINTSTPSDPWSATWTKSSGVVKSQALKLTGTLQQLVSNNYIPIKSEFQSEVTARITADASLSAVIGAPDNRMLASGISTLTLNGFATSGSSITATGSSDVSSHTAYYNTDTVVEKLDVYFKCNVTAAQVSTGNIAFGIGRNSNLAGTYVLFRHTSTQDICQVYKFDGTTPTLSTTFNIGFTLTTGEYTLRLGKRTGNLLIELWKDTGDYFSDNSLNYSSTSTFGAQWGKPTFLCHSGTMAVTGFQLMTPYQQKGKIVAFMNSFGEGNSLGGDFASRYIAKLAARIGDNQIAVCARGGESSSSIASRFDQELSWFSGYQYAYIPIGENDTDTTAWKTNMQGMIAKVKAKGMIPILATITPRFDGSNNTAYVSKMNTWVRSLGELYIDVVKAVTTDGAVTYRSGDLMADNVHPTVQGHTHIYNRACFDLPWLFTPRSN